MFQMRHLLLSLASSSALYSAVTPALGLGDAHIHSYLNQPLAAEIELVELGDLTNQDVRVRLATADDFERAGVERFYFLNDLRFSPMLANGRGSIRVTSSRPVKEPYLNFIVEVARPGGRLLREYTFLIDPLGSSAASFPAQPVAQLAQLTRAAEPSIRPPAQVPSATQGLSYQVRSGDSLWRIAGRLATSGVNREALMADILALNPQAFVGGDPARLRLVELRLPDVLASVNAVAAPVAETAAPITPPEPPQPAQAPAEVIRGEELIEQQAAREAAELQNLELLQSVRELQVQMAALQEQVQAKNEQLALLQQLNEQRPPANATAEPVTENTVQAQAASTLPNNTWYWGLAGALTALAASLVFWRRATPAPAPTPEAKPAPATAAAKPAKVASSSVSSARVVPESASALPAPDALEGANIYMAYGRYADAAQALLKASVQEPQRTELRLRLLEAYGELNALDSFTELEQQLRAEGHTRQVYPIKARYSAQFKSLQPQQSVVPMMEEASEWLPDDFQLDLDDLSLETDKSLVAPMEPDQPARLKAVQTQWQENFKPALNGLPEVSEWAESDLNTDFVLDDNITLDDEVKQLASSDEHLQQLDQALAFMELGDISKACDALNESINSSDEQERPHERLAKNA